MDVEIRDATADDAVDIAALLGEFGYAPHPAALRSRLDVLTGDGNVVLSLAVSGWSAWCQPPRSCWPKRPRWCASRR